LAAHIPAPAVELDAKMGCIKLGAAAADLNTVVEVQNRE
jgi:hypothetical protein